MWLVAGGEKPRPHIPPTTYHLPFYCIRCGGIRKSSLSRREKWTSRTFPSRTVRGQSVRGKSQVAKSMEKTANRARYVRSPAIANSGVFLSNRALNACTA